MCNCGRPPPPPSRKRSKQEEREREAQFEKVGGVCGLVVIWVTVTLLSPSATGRQRERLV